MTISPKNLDKLLQRKKEKSERARKEEMAHELATRIFVHLSEHCGDSDAVDERLANLSFRAARTFVFVQKQQWDKFKEDELAHSLDSKKKEDILKNNTDANQQD